MDRALVEIGLIVAGNIDEIDRVSVTEAADQLHAYLQQTHPDIHFQIIRLDLPEVASESRAQPSVLLQHAADQRDLRHLDFVLLVTAADLESFYSPRCLAALSRPLDAAVVSLSLIDPRAVGESRSRDQRIQQVSHRLSRLLLHAMGHLTGLARSGRSNNLMRRPVEVNELESMEELDAWQVQRQHDSLVEVADQRLEESPQKSHNAMMFTLRAAWINRFEIVQAIIAAKPWEFPRRLSGLTLASVSTLAILFMSAESWDLALSQDFGQIVFTAVLACLVTTVYVIVRQQLISDGRRQRSEQMVVANSSASGIVLLGMSITWLSLGLLGILIGYLLFDADLIATWASSTQSSADTVGWGERLQMSVFSASLGLIIGALGASFESQHYFRHVIFVDEEI
ncbi:hypothetical protein SAMN05421690_100376 [Nitrosomonas sp. Nm51]|uniref:hypothetical protein n=1 Tax=Nitrosomonas sp. Nm51 TaxID=133720 RepID=UPI0008BE7AF3|nr:hypothetical protein [Nitrosomonas sp. Nm51]SEQ90428.1 hypothetical protein SAMN05421690_100376 [Nitrosomonas sp. Nm51]